MALSLDLWSIVFLAGFWALAFYVGWSESTQKIGRDWTARRTGYFAFRTLSIGVWITLSLLADRAHSIGLITGVTAAIVIGGSFAAYGASYLLAERCIRRRTSNV